MSEPLVDATAIVTNPARAVIEIERLRGEVDLLRTMERELMAILPYDDEDVETSLVVNAAQLRAELARRDEQIAAVRALTKHSWLSNGDILEALGGAS